MTTNKEDIRIFTFAKSTIIYVSAVTLSALFSLLSAPIFTAYLTPGEYGTAALFQSCYTTMAIFVGLQCIGPAEVKYFATKNSQIGQKKLIESCIEILVISSLVIGLLLLLYSIFNNKSSPLPYSWIWLAFLVSIASFIIQLRLGQWRVREEATSYAILLVSQTAITILASLWLVAIEHKGAFGRVMGLVVSGAILGIFSIYSLKKDGLWGHPKFSSDNWKERLKPGLALIPHAIGGIFIGTVDRLLITHQLGINNTGIYTLSVQMCLPIGLLFAGINNAYTVWLYSRLSVIDSFSENLDQVFLMKRRIVKRTYMFFVGTLILSSVIVIIAKLFLHYYVDARYSEATNLLVWIALGFSLEGMYYGVVGYILYAKKNILLSSATISSSLISIPIFIVSMKYFGLVGAAIAYAILQSIKFTSVWILAQHSYPMPWFQVRMKNMRI